VPSDKGEVRAGYYISGGRGFDPEEADSLCDLPYFPERRFLKSEFLDEIKRQAQAHPQLCAFIDYTLRLGGAGLLTKFALAELASKYRLIVGFDSGDFMWINGPSAST
jgi:hypothetical protein